MKKLLTSIILLTSLLISPIYSQNTDSLWSAWQNTMFTDEDRMNALMTYNKQVYLYNRPDTALLFANTLFEFADSIGNEEYQARAINLKAAAHGINGNYDKAQENFMQYLEMAKELDDPSMIAAASKNIGDIHGLKNEYEKAIEYYDLVLEQKDESDKISVIIGAQFGLAKIHFKKGNYDLAIEEHLEVLKLSREHNQSRYESAVLNELLSVHRIKGDYAKAIEFGIRGLQVAERINNQRSVGNITNSIGNIYSSQKDFEKALEYYNKALEKYKETANKNGVGLAYGNLANIYLQLNDVEQSLSHYKMSLEIQEVIGDKIRIANTLLGLSDVFQTKKDYNAAIQHASRSLSIAKSIDYKKGIVEANNYLSSIYFKQGNLTSSISSGNEALILADELGLLARKRSITLLLYEVYKKQGNADLALNMFELHNTAKDSLNKEDNVREVLKSTYQYESDKRAAIDSIQYLGEKKILSERNAVQSKLLLGSTVALLLFLLLSYFIYRLYRKTNKQNEVISEALNEKDILLREIHHRVKNNLQLVSSLLTLQSRHVDDPKALEALNSGKARVKSMALIHQNLYNKENLTGINIKSYLEKLCNELINTYHIDEEKIQLTTSIQDIDLDIDTIVPLGLIINELITNAIKYAFPDGASGEINIKLEEINDELRLSISDNGVGLPQDYGQQNSFGYKLINTLNDQLDGKMEQLSDNGTTVNLYFKDYKVAS